MKKIFIVLGFLLPGLAFAQTNTQVQIPQQTITLSDGTTIKGKLIEVSGDHYTIQNDTMGAVTVPASKVLNISTAGSPGNTTNIAAPQFNQTQNPSLNPADVQKNMISDPEIMAMVQDLVNDPSAMEILKDPGILQDAMSMDASKVQDNPKVKALMENPKMQAIIHRFEEKYHLNTPESHPQPDMIKTKIN